MPAATECPSPHRGVLVSHFALDDALAKGAIVFGGRNPRLPLCWRIESRMGHPERSKDFLPRKEVERHASLAGQHFSQQDEAHVAVLGARARRGNQPRGKRGPNEFLARGGNLKQLLVSRQSAGVGKQHEQGDRLSRGLLMSWGPRHKIGEEVSQGNVQWQLSAFVQQHGHGGGSHDLGHGCQIEDGVRLNRWRVVLIGEAAKSSQRDQRSAMSDSDRSGRESALLDGFAKNGKSSRELLVLEVESRWQVCELWRRLVQNHLEMRSQLIIACRGNKRVSGLKPAV